MSDINALQIERQMYLVQEFFHWERYQAIDITYFTQLYDSSYLKVQAKSRIFLDPKIASSLLINHWLKIIWKLDEI